MLKTTALVSTIAVPELLQQTQGIINTTYATVPLFIMASIWYLVMTSVLTIGQYYLERHYRRGSEFGQPGQALPGRLWHAIRYIRPGNDQAALLSSGREHR
jgi:hypothetical protein